MKDKAYFASDFHLGAPDKILSAEREKRIIQWLDFIKNDAEYLFLLGDIFDFWYEWKHVVPKGFVRFLNKIAELVESGTKVYYFTGNHDIWAYNYLADEIGVKIFREPKLFEINGLKIYVGHGDGLGNHDKKYKMLKYLFTNKILQWMFSNLLHPNFAIWLGKKWSLSRNAYSRKPVFHGETEWIVEYIKQNMSNIQADCYIFGHRHCNAEFMINQNTKYINTGVWFNKSPYAILANKNITLKNFQAD
ncbi:MAG: UDP-2,3-diacylglucosamine diphosphatase [Bacteroidales bacterium]|nr:UDP-2,3-diacylglucosamine diphosphatase [Bacteroidales bacterium]